MALNKKHDELVDWFLKTLQPGEDNHDKYRKKWKHLREVYLGTSNRSGNQDYRRFGAPYTREPDEDGEGLFVKHILQMVHTIMPRMTVPDPAFDIQPQEPTDENIVDLYKGMMRHDLEVDNYALKQHNWIKPALEYGLGVVKITWLYEEYERVIEKQLSPRQRLMGESPSVKKKIIKSDRPHVTPVDPNDFIWDAAATCLDDARWVVHRTWATLEDLKRKQEAGVYENVDELDKLMSSGDEDEIRAGENTEISRARRGDRIEILEMHTADRRVITLAARKVIVRNTPTPFNHGEFPFATFTIEPDDFSFVGMSVVELVEDIQEAIWVMENQRIDLVRLRLDPPISVLKSLKGGKDIQIGPRARVLLDRHDQISTIDLDLNAGPGWDEVQAYLGYMQQISGVNPFIAGIDGSQQNVDQSTATGINILVEGAEKRIGQQVLYLNEGVRRIGRQMVQLYQQYLTPGRVRKIMGPAGPQYVEVDVEAIVGEFDVRVKGSGESINNELKRAASVEVINALGPLQGAPMSDGTVVDIKPALVKLIESFNIGDPSEFFKEPSPTQQLNSLPPEVLAESEQGLLG